MGGRPVWLASVSYRDQRGIIPTTKYSRQMRKHAKRQAWNAVEGRGDHDRFRLFRMQITICLHVAVSDDELEKLPAEWNRWPGTALAGGPVEILEERGIPDIPSTKPCKDPVREPLGLGDPDLWVPIDCGRCGPCMARATIEGP